MHAKLQRATSIINSALFHGNISIIFNFSTFRSNYSSQNVPKKAYFHLFLVLQTRGTKARAFAFCRSVFQTFFLFLHVKGSHFWTPTFPIINWTKTRNFQQKHMENYIFYETRTCLLSDFARIMIFIVRAKKLKKTFEYEQFWSQEFAN